MTRFLAPLDHHNLSDVGLDGWTYGYRDRVRFYELDALNHVNNVVFLKWFETIRVTYVQDYGFSSYGEDDPQLVVRRVTADFLAPMHQNQDYIVAARTTVVKPSSFFMEYAVVADDNICATGEAVGISLEQDGKTRREHNLIAINNVIQRDGAKKSGFV
ncbi:MAG: acyl-CoA thioesterase [Boseongicola sp.]|nr:MAG: acyl-CoA thioesterase [Boseongicola sp.]